MQLTEIDKTRYDRHLKIVFAGIAIALLVISLAASTLFIQLFSTAQAPHFWHNLAGVAVAVIVVVLVMGKIREHPYLTEVVYVWDLKQLLNKIQRKQRAIEVRVEANDRTAMIILNFQYQGSKQLYQLDNNTITMDDLLIKIQHLDKRMDAAGLNITSVNLEPALIEQF